MSRLPANQAEMLAQICDEFQVNILYAFGSRADEVKERLTKERARLSRGTADVDVGAKVNPKARLSFRDKVRLTIALEDLLGEARMDLVCLNDADPFLAANIIRGERLYARDTYAADEYDLYVLRRAGDMAPLERERMALILGEEL